MRIAVVMGVWECYKSQHHRTSVDGAMLGGLAMARGAQARTQNWRLAEAYEVVRLR